MAISIADARMYLGIDVATDELINANVQRALEAAERLMQGAVGDDVREHLSDHSKIDQLVLTYLEDLYNDRGVSAKVSGANRRLVADMETQLRLELARAKEGTV